MRKLTLVLLACSGLVFAEETFVYRNGVKYRQVCEGNVCRYYPVNEVPKYRLEASEGQWNLYEGDKQIGAFTGDKFMWYTDGVWSEPLWRDKPVGDDPFKVGKAGNCKCPEVCQCALCKDNCQCASGKLCREGCPCAAVVGDLPPPAANAQVAAEALWKHPGVITDRVPHKERYAINDLTVSKDVFIEAATGGESYADQIPNDAQLAFVVALGKEVCKEAKHDFSTDPELVMLSNQVRLQCYEDSSNPIVSKAGYPKSGLLFLAANGTALHYRDGYPGAFLVAQDIKSYGGKRLPDPNFDINKVADWGAMVMGKGWFGIPWLVWAAGAVLAYFAFTNKQESR